MLSTLYLLFDRGKDNLCSFVTDFKGKVGFSKFDNIGESKWINFNCERTLIMAIELRRGLINNAI